MKLQGLRNSKEAPSRAFLVGELQGRTGPPGQQVLYQGEASLGQRNAGEGRY